MAYSGMNDIARLLMAQQMAQPSMNNAMAVQQPVPQQAIPRGASRSQQLLAQQLMQAGTDTSPVGHWTQALARVVQGGVGGHMQRKQDTAEGERQTAIGEALKGLQGGDQGQVANLANAGPEAMQAAMFAKQMGPQPRQAPTTRQVKSGAELVTQEWDGEKWNDVGRAALSATEQDGRTREIKNFEYRNGLKSDQERSAFDAGVRAAQVVDLGGVPTQLSPEGPKPLSTLPAENAADQAKSAAQAAGTASVAEATKAKANARTFETYQVGMKALESALDKAETGPIAGRLPAVTAAAQTAEGAGATMAPVLKTLFRDAGEGTFSQGDQDLLMKLVPNRTEHPEARKAKIQMIDEIVKSRLGVGAPQSAPAKADGWQVVDGVKVRVKKP